MATDELRAVLQGADTWAVDLLVSCLCSAACSYRRSSCTVPFPSSVFEGVDGKDYAALQETAHSLPAAATLAGPAASAAVVEGLSQQQASLLQWLLTHPRRPVGGMRRCTLRQVQEQLPSLHGWVADIGSNPSLKPHAVLQLAAVPPEVVGPTRVLAFHGTALENMHSILHNGLLNLSGTRLERTGAAFGKGIYFSTELPVAFAFCQPADGWRHSALGRRLRCLLVCSIDREHLLGAHNSDLVPEKYIVVERMDAVTMHFCFLYSDDARPGAPLSPISPAPQAAAAAAAQHLPLPPQQQHLAHVQHPQQMHGAAHPPQRHRTSPLLYVLGAYLLWLAWLWMRENWPYLRRVLRRQFGLVWL